MRFPRQWAHSNPVVGALLTSAICFLFLSSQVVLVFWLGSAYLPALPCIMSAKSIQAASPGALPSLYARLVCLVSLLLYQLSVVIAQLLLRLSRFLGRAQTPTLDALAPHEYPRQAYWGYDYFLWYLQLPLMWRSSPDMVNQVYEMFVTDNTIELGPGSGYFARKSKALANISKRSLLLRQPSRYDVLDIVSLPLEYTSYSLQQHWKRLAKRLTSSGIQASVAPEKLSPPTVRKLVADITNLDSVRDALSKSGGRRYQTVVANQVIHCVRNPERLASSNTGKRPTPKQLGEEKMRLIFQGMAELLLPGGSIIGSTALGPHCSSWDFTNIYFHTAAVEASNGLCRLGIFDNENDTYDAIIKGARQAKLEVKMAKVTGSMITFVFSKPMTEA